MFQVFDCDKPADSAHQKYLKPGYGWDNSIFKTFKEAEKYALNYLGAYAPSFLKLNTPFCYYSDGEKESSLVIRKTPSSNISASRSIIEEIVSYFPEETRLSHFDFEWENDGYKVFATQNFGEKQQLLNGLYRALITLIHDPIAEKHFGESSSCVRIKTGKATVSKDKIIAVVIREYFMHKETEVVVSINLG